MFQGIPLDNSLSVINFSPFRQNMIIFINTMIITHHEDVPYLTLQCLVNACFRYQFSFKYLHYFTYQ